MIDAPSRVGRVVVIDAHPIFRRGLVACLVGLDGVEAVEGAGSVAEARTGESLTEADLILVDHEIEEALELVAELAHQKGKRVVVCSDSQSPELVRASIAAGAIGLLCKATLRPETLLAALLAAASGNGILAPGMLSALAGGPTAGHEAPTLVLGSPIISPLTEREHSVLALIADGRPTREVARELAYSERTVKNVLHDVVVKLGARSRSHAVAHAVRERLI